MNVLIDTNVILDVLLERKPHYENAARINVLCEKGYLNGYISASAITDIFYVAEKELKNKNTAIELLKNILKTTHIASVTESDIKRALNLRWDDFEDSVQYVIGESISAEYIITRNSKDFVNSQIKAVSPDEFLSIVAL